MPGAKREDLNIRVEEGILTISGQASLEIAGDMEYSEFAVQNYHRAFRLSDDVDIEKIDASLKNGVLSLTLPRSEAAKPRQIEVRSAI